MIEGYRLVGFNRITLGECLPVGIIWSINKDRKPLIEEIIHYHVIKGNNAQVMPIFGEAYKETVDQAIYWEMFKKRFQVPYYMTVNCYAPIVEGVYQALATIDSESYKEMEIFETLAGFHKLPYDEKKILEVYESRYSEEKKVLIDLTEKISNVCGCFDIKGKIRILLLIAHEILWTVNPIKALEYLIKMSQKNRYNDIYDLREEIYNFLKSKKVGILPWPTFHTQIEGGLEVLGLIMDNISNFSTNLVRESLIGSISILTGVNLGSQLHITYDFEDNLPSVFLHNSKPPKSVDIISDDLNSCEVAQIFQEFLKSFPSTKIFSHPDEIDDKMVEICINLEKFFSDVKKVEKNIDIKNLNCKGCILLFGARNIFSINRINGKKNFEQDFSVIKNSCYGYGEWLVSELNKRKQFALTGIEEISRKFRQD